MLIDQWRGKIEFHKKDSCMILFHVRNLGNLGNLGNSCLSVYVRREAKRGESVGGQEIVSWS